MTRKQQKAVAACQRTLDNIDMEKFSRRVLEAVAPLVKANEEVRRKSLQAAQHKVLR